MTTIDKAPAAEDAAFASDITRADTVGEAVRSYGQRLRGGDMGSLPAVLGLVVLFVVFSLANETFLTALNMANLVTQAGAICVLAMGLIPVLLLGDIDLSAGVAGGVAACVTGLVVTDQGQVWWIGVIAGLVAGVVMGYLNGVLVAKLGIPSFVVTLAFFLALQGVTLRLIGEGGSVRIADPVLRGLTIDNMSVLGGWLSAVGVVVVFALLSLNRFRTQVAKGLQHPPLGIVVAKIVGLAVVVVGITLVLNANRSLNPNFPIAGVPWVLPVVAVLLIAWTFVFTKTGFGRHLYAVGGNREAARRAGIKVDRIRISAFVICSTMAAISGILAASYTGKVSASSGAGNTLLYAVGAAVIGGTSLFGGKGKAQDAVVGGLVIATIANGLGLLNQASYINFLVTGGVLLLAASVDALSRRRRSASGIG